jgi:hypothetical protein
MPIERISFTKIEPPQLRARLDAQLSALWRGHLQRPAAAANAVNQSCSF